MSHDAATLGALQAFRAAALQIRNASIIASGATVSMQGSDGEQGVQTRFQILADEAFRSLAISVRLIYMQEARANFYRICNILYRHGDPGIQSRAADSRTRYKSILQGKYVQFNLHGEFEGRVAGPQEVFEAWLYGLVFHQDPEHHAVAKELGKYMDGYAFPFAVNMVALQLAGAILDLDDIIADHLTEPRVPRIGSEPEQEPAG